MCFSPALPRQFRNFPLHLWLVVTWVMVVGSGRQVEAQPGLLDPTFHAGMTNPVVNDLLVQSDGHILFRYGYSGLARLDTDGNLDENFNPGLPPGSTVAAMGAQTDGRFFIAGNFLRLQGVPRPCLARFNVDGTLDGGFVPQILAGNLPAPATNTPPVPFSPANNIGMILVQPDGKVLVSVMSYMLATNGGKLPALVRFNADGSLDNGFAIITNTPYRMALQSDGKILIEENINWNYPGSNIVYRLNPDGTRDAGFNLVKISGWANSILQQGSNLLLGGWIYRINGINSGWVVRLIANGQLDSGFHSKSYDYGNGIITAIPQIAGKVLIAGTFGMTGSSNANLARLNPDGSLDTTYACTGASSYVNALAAQPDGKTLVGGDFTVLNGTAVPPLVRLSGDSADGPGTVLFATPTAEVFENAGSVSVTVNRIWGNQGDIAVNYQTRSGSALAGSDYEAQSGSLVFLDGEMSKTITVPIIDDTYIEDLETFQVCLTSTVGGASLGVQSNCIVSILDDDGPASFDPTFAIPPGTFDGTVNDVAVQPDGGIVVGGWFQQVAGQIRRGIARLNADGSLDPTFDPGSGLAYSGSAGWLNLIKLQADAKILIAGIFTQVNGIAKNYLARLNADGSLDSGFDDGTGPISGNVVGDIRGLELMPDGSILLGGGFATYNGITRNGLARLTPNGSVDPAYHPTGVGAVGSLDLQADGKVVFAPDLGNYAYRINADGSNTRTNADGTSSQLFICYGNSYIRQVSSQPDGTTLLAGSFSTLNGLPRRCLARLLSDGSVDPSFYPDLSLFLNATSTPPYVYKTTVQPDGKVLAALKSYVAPSGNYLVRLNTDGTLDTDFEPLRFAIPLGDNDTISAIKLQNDNSILVSGQFQTVNGLSRPYLVRLKGGAKSGSRPLLVKSLVLSGPQCGLSLAVAPAKTFVLQFSTDTVHWTDVVTNTVLTSVYNVMDTRIGSASQCFYRIKQFSP